MTKHFTHLLLAFLLLCAQALAVAHPIEHAMDEGQGAPAHVCERCIAAHDLGGGAPLSLFTIPILAGEWLPIGFAAPSIAPQALPEARQQSPPYA